MKKMHFAPKVLTGRASGFRTAKRELNSADRRERRILVTCLLVTAALIVLWAVLMGVKIGFSSKLQPRTNTRQEGTDRVYDYAGMLTDDQKEQLEEKIAAAEEKMKADLVIVIINESLEKKYPDLIYMKSDETDAYRGIQRYAESYWDENGFGWNKPGDEGNGIIMVDNIYRESNGWVYNWVAGSGDLRYSVGDHSCEELSQKFTDRLPSGDLPPHSWTYFQSMMQFVSDCEEISSDMHTVMSWKAYTPGGIALALTSSLTAFIVVLALESVILGRMFWQLRYNGRKKRKKAKKGVSILNGFSYGMFFVVLGIIYSLLSGTAALIMFFVIFMITLARTFFETSGGRRRKEEKKDPAPFSNKDPLEPDSYRITVNRDEFIRHYHTSYTRSSSSGGSSGSGGHSGGGHSGGGHSGGGSHR